MAKTILEDPRVQLLIVIFAIIFVLGYVLMPIDAIPDFIPFIGMLDDIAVICGATVFIMNTMR